MTSSINEKLRKLGQQFLSKQTRRRLVRLSLWPPVGLVRSISLNRRRPISSTWGSERGEPVDRYYITRFLESHAGDIRGCILEIGTDMYTRRFGGERVVKSDVLHVAENKPAVTIIGDLTDAGHIPSDSFDCIILTQTLQFIYDVPAVIRTVYRLLKPGGVVLVTVPGISNISRYDMDHWGHYWSFTTKSARLLFEEVFPAANIEVTARGNVASSVAFLHGIASEELRRKNLDYHDPDYELLVAIRAVKPQVKS